MRLFYSYSHRDERLRDELEAHLAVLKRKGVIENWHDRKIEAGDDWRGSIDAELEAADIILLLVSSSFLNSDYCYDVEMTRALERHAQGSAKVIPVILRPCLWKEAPFGKLQALPTGGKPVTDWSNKDKAFTDIAEVLSAQIEPWLELVDPDREMRAIPLSPDLKLELDTVKVSCKKLNVPFVTSCLLLALLRIHGVGKTLGFATARLDEIRPNLSNEITSLLEDYVRRILPSSGGEFRPFVWIERSEIQRAQFHALNDHSSEVNEKHLLLAVLEEDSRAVIELKAYLGEKDFDRLVKTCEIRPWNYGLGRRPGVMHRRNGDLAPPK